MTDRRRGHRRGDRSGDLVELGAGRQFSRVNRRNWQKVEKKGRKKKEVDEVICGIRIEEIDDPLMRNIRYLDKLVDQLAKGRPMEKILRG